MYANKNRSRHRKKIIMHRIWQYIYFITFVSFIFPNGEISSVSADTQDDENYMQKLSIYIHAKSLSGGILLTND